MDFILVYKIESDENRVKNPIAFDVLCFIILLGNFIIFKLGIQHCLPYHIV